MQECCFQVILDNVLTFELALYHVRRSNNTTWTKFYWVTSSWARCFYSWYAETGQSGPIPRHFKPHHHRRWVVTFLNFGNFCFGFVLCLSIPLSFYLLNFCSMVKMFSSVKIFWTNFYHTQTYNSFLIFWVICVLSKRRGGSWCTFCKFGDPNLLREHVNGSWYKFISWERIFCLGLGLWVIRVCTAFTALFAQAEQGWPAHWQSQTSPVSLKSFFNAVNMTFLHFKPTEKHVYHLHCAMPCL